MKKLSLVSLVLALTMLALFSFAACNGRKRFNKDGYLLETLPFYRFSNDKEDDVEVRFYKTAPNVPYVGVNWFYTYFYEFELEVNRNGSEYTFALDDSTYLKFDTKKGSFASMNMMNFSYADFFASSDSKDFVHSIPSKTEETEPTEMVVSLADYDIAIYGDETDVYAPIALLTVISGGPSWYGVAYNGKGLYAFDGYGFVTGEEIDYTLYEGYLDTILDLKTKRPSDVIQYTYNLLCLTFDHFRGYTAQLYLGDENLLELGLDGLLDAFTEITVGGVKPKGYVGIKDALLSPDKSLYLAGYYGLLFALSDGGHTSPLMFDEATLEYLTGIVNIEEAHSAYLAYAAAYQDEIGISNAIGKARSTIMGVSYDADEYGYYVFDGDEFGYYYFDEATKTAYIGFDGYEEDFLAWDEFYSSGAGEEDAPVDTDTYAYVRSKLYQALSDGAENVVLDEADNGGGINFALHGVVGLFNGAISYETRYSRDNDVYYTEYLGIDVDLDGDFDDDDVKEAEKFKSLNVGVLTSAGSFSNGNTMPFIMQELGYKVIGQRSGGGNCNLFLGITADGLTFCYSGYTMGTNASHENLDKGVTPDLAVSLYDNKGNPDASGLYDFAAIAKYLKEAYADGSVE